MANFKIVKAKEWSSSTGGKGTTLVLAAAGRVVTCNQGDFETGLTVKGDVCSITAPFVVTKDSYIKTDGTQATGLRIKPKVEWEFSDF